MQKEQTIKTCFVIAPIGKEGSETRMRSDQILKHIIEPAVKECGFGAVRADQISEPGIITSQIIQHIVDDPLVIADLTGRNPNVFYELALRHAIKKPVVQIIDSAEYIPFDVASTRTIHVDHHDLDSVAAAKREIVKQIQTVEENPTDVDSPISAALELQLLRRSDNLLEKSNAEIIDLVQDLRVSVEELRHISGGMIGLERLVELEHLLVQINSMITLDDDQEFELRKLDDVRLLLVKGIKNIRIVLRQSSGISYARTLTLTALDSIYSS